MHGGFETAMHKPHETAMHGKREYEMHGGRNRSRCTMPERRAVERAVSQSSNAPFRASPFVHRASRISYSRFPCIAVSPIVHRRSARQGQRRNTSSTGVIFTFSAPI